jgi:hypothetical protein
MKPSGGSWWRTRSPVRSIAVWDAEAMLWVTLEREVPRLREGVLVVGDCASGGGVDAIVR